MPYRYERDRMVSTLLRSAERIEDGDADDLFAASEVLHAETAADPIFEAAYGPVESEEDDSAPIDSQR